VKIEKVKISSLTLDPENARTHSTKNVDAISGSLKQFGQRKPIVVYDNIVIAGNGTIEAAKKLEWTDIEITRAPADWTFDQARAFALADNRTGELADWDMSLLTEQLLELDAVGFDVSEFGFMTLDPYAEDADENPYTPNVNAPQYNIVGDQPEPRQLYDQTKAEELSNSIKKIEGLDPSVKEFLLIATNRHIVFDYGKIAEYYPHATPEIQQLMEESALIIIDFDDAMKNGYVKVQSTIEELVKEDRYGA